METSPADAVVGRIAGVFGLHGELKCDPTGAGRIVFKPGAELRCDVAETSRPIRLESVREHKRRLLLRIAGVDDADTASAYAGGVLYAPRAQIALEAGEYLDADLVGCAVVGVDERAYGTVERVEHFPASDMLVVAGKFVPMVAAIVKAIDLSARRITIDPPLDLLD